MFAALATTLAPLVYLSALKDPFRLPKTLLSESLALLSLSFLASSVPSAVAAAGGWRARRPLLLAAAAMVAIASLGLVTSPHPLHVREALPSFLIAVAAALGWSLAIPPRTLRRLLDLLMVPATIFAAVGVAQFHDVWQPFAFDSSLTDPRLRITSLAGNVADFADFLVPPMLIAQARIWELWRSHRRPRARLFFWCAAFALCLYALALTSTLTALAAIVVSTLVLWLVLIDRKARFALAFALVVCAAALAVGAGPLRPRAAEKMRELRHGEINSLLTGRLDGWRAGLFMARARPLSGVGLGAFAAEFAPAKLALLERGVPFYPGQRTAMFGNAHNEAIEVAAESGVPGLAALAGAVAVMAIAARRALGERLDRGGHADGAVAAAGLVSFATLAAGGFPFRIAITGYQAVLFGAWLLATAAARSAAREPAAPERGPSSSRPTARSPARRRVTAVVATAVVLALWALHARRSLDRIAASAALQRVESTTALMLDAHRTMPAAVQANRRVLLDLRQRDPSEVAVLTALAAQYVLLERWREALEWYQRGLELEPRPEIYFGRGTAQLRLGDREAARESFATAVKLSPPLQNELPLEAR